MLRHRTEIDAVSKEKVLSVRSLLEQRLRGRLRSLALDFSHVARPSNDTAVQRRAREGAKRPTRPSVCNGGLDRAYLERLSRHADNDPIGAMDLNETSPVGC